ncbi:hypothetical protein [Micromonospora sp. CA-111912]|uniref:hypothetical protein n=1 Tax=Micromonospora sp. CA-111912 TaxID=3239955 RepID=UPI003D8F2453
MAKTVRPPGRAAGPGHDGRRAAGRGHRPAGGEAVSPDDSAGHEPAPAPGELSPGHRESLRRLLERELTEAWRAARAAGVPPAALAALVTDRARALWLLGGLTDDAQHLVDDASDGIGVVEQG